MNNPPAKLHIKNDENIHTLQLRRQFSWVTILILLFFLATLLPIFGSNQIIVTVITSLLLLAHFIYYATPSIKTVLFGEKIIWVPETKELVVKSSKYKIGSSSFIGFSKEEKIIKYKKTHTFHFKLIESEQNQSVPLFSAFKFADSERSKFVEIGEQLSQLFEVPAKMPSLERTEVRNSKKMVDSYLGKLQSDSEFISPPPNTFVSAQMVDTLTVPEKISHCITLSEKPVTIELTFKGTAKKTRLRTYIILAFIITTLLPQFVFFVFFPYLLWYLIGIFSFLLGMAGMALSIYFIHLVLLHYGIETKNQGSLAIGYKNVTIIRISRTEKTFTFSLDKLQGIDAVLMTTQEFTIKFQDKHSVVNFGIFKKEEAEQLKSLIDTIICKQYHENELARSETQGSADVLEDTVSETSKVKHDKPVNTQSINASETSKVKHDKPVDAQSINASDSRHYENKVTRTQLEKKLTNLIKVEETTSFTQISFCKPHLKGNLVKIFNFGIACFVMTLVMTFVIMIILGNRLQSYGSLVLLVIAISSLVFSMGLLSVIKTKNHVLYISNNGIEYRRHICGFEKSIMKIKFKELESIKVIHPEKNEKHYALKLISNQELFDKQLKAKKFGKFTQEEAEFIRMYLKQTIFEVYNAKITHYRE